MLVEHRGALRVSELPLSESTRRILAAKRPSWESLGRLLDRLQVPVDDVANELAALTVMRAYRLRALAGQPSPSRRAPRQPAVPTTDRTSLVLRRLEREVKLLESADVWTTVGVARGSDQTVIQAALDRQRDRYARLETEPALDDAGRALVAIILESVEAAGAQLLQVEEAPPEHVWPDDARRETFFQNGKLALESRCFSRAVQWFEAAREAAPQPGRELAWLGWAVFLDTEREGRMTEARDLLEMADMLGTDSVDVQYFLPVVEAKSGRPRRAKARLERLLTQVPDHVDARRVLDRLR
ncbi:MAG: hypothetical protein GY913_14190 [Proteobacteria bacterium]|nr:hypothetical protein [Pseudomonadota bacterium]MCP4918058.1 hypothetical protein [Pseudomonadota bacterium]